MITKRLAFTDAAVRGRRAAFRDSPENDPPGTREAREHVASFPPGNYGWMQDGAGFHVWRYVPATPSNGLIYGGSNNPRDLEGEAAPPTPQAFRRPGAAEAGGGTGNMWGGSEPPGMPKLTGDAIKQRTINMLNAEYWKTRQWQPPKAASR